jgi:glycosyltransferase involved in cell wall biosynthesis
LPLLRLEETGDERQAGHGYSDRSPLPRRNGAPPPGGSAGPEDHLYWQCLQFTLHPQRRHVLKSKLVLQIPARQFVKARFAEATDSPLIQILGRVGVPGQQSEPKRNPIVWSIWSRPENETICTEYSCLERCTMKVVFVYRQKRRGAHSIEVLFHTVAGELGRKIEVVEYVAGCRSRLLLDAWRLRKLNADIYHVTGDIHYIVNLLPSRKTVLTVHDIHHYLNDLRGIKRLLYKWIWLILPIRSARAITAISRETGKAIHKHLAITGKHIQVIENCHSAIFRRVPKSFSAQCPVILQVGTDANKNVRRLVEALQGLHCRLVLIGSIDDELQQKLNECGTVFENHAGLTHEELNRQYIDCDIVAFASLAEGFGVPIIEAQAVGRPLITSNISPMREVAGDGACLIDPLDVAQIRDGILRIIGDPLYRNHLIENGLRNVTRYSPARISDHYLAFYEALLHT